MGIAATLIAGAVLRRPIQVATATAVVSQSVVPLVGENRCFVTHGLERLRRGDRCGFRSLIEVAGLQAEELNAGRLGFSLAPRINAAAEAVGRPKPRICAGFPIAVTDDPIAARQQAAENFVRYGQLPSYRRMLDIEAVESPADIAIVGSEDEVESQLRAIADAGATELLASIFPVGDDEEASVSRTRALLKSLIGKI